MVADRRHRSGLLSDCFHRRRSRCRHPIPVQGLEDPAAARRRAPLPGGARPPRHATRNTRTPPNRHSHASNPPPAAQRLREHRRRHHLRAAIRFHHHQPLQRIRSVKQIRGRRRRGNPLPGLLPHRRNRQERVAHRHRLGDGGSPHPHHQRAHRSRPVLGARRMGEIRALATTMGGSVDTDAQAASWTLTARLPTAASAPS